MACECECDPERLEEIKNDLHEIKQALLGDGYGNKGFASRLGDVEDKVKTLISQRYINIGIWIAVTGLAAYAVFMIKTIPGV